MSAVTTKRTLARLKERGFDMAHVIKGEPGMIRPKCSQCASLVINGVACHETGCPNATQECAGCNATVPARQKYCQDCQ